MTFEMRPCFVVSWVAVGLGFIWVRGSVFVTTYEYESHAVSMTMVLRFC